MVGAFDTTLSENARVVDERIYPILKKVGVYINLYDSGVGSWRYKNEALNRLYMYISAY